jgi:hypothetical protein
LTVTVEQRIALHHDYFAQIKPGTIPEGFRYWAEEEIIKLRAKVKYLEGVAKWLNEQLIDREQNGL